MTTQETPASGLERDNPSQAADAGQEGAGGFLDGLAQESGSGDHAASQQAAPGSDAAQDQSGASATSTLPKFATALPKESRADPKVVQFISKFKSWDELTKAAIELETKLGKAGTDEKASVPEKPEDYNLGEIGDNQVTIDQATKFKSFAHKLHLTQKQALAIWNEGREELASMLSNAAARNIAEKAKLEERLKEEWGNSYEANRKVMARGLVLMDKDLLQDIKQAGLASSYSVAMHLYRLGRLLGEDAGISKGPSIAEFKSGIDRPGL